MPAKLVMSSRLAPRLPSPHCLSTDSLPLVLPLILQLSQVRKAGKEGGGRVRANKKAPDIKFHLIFLFPVGLPDWTRLSVSSLSARSYRRRRRPKNESWDAIHQGTQLWRFTPRVGFAFGVRLTVELSWKGAGKSNRGTAFSHYILIFHRFIYCKGDMMTYRFSLWEQIFWKLLIPNLRRVWN